MEGILGWIDRFRTPLTVVLVAAIVVGGSVLAVRSLELRSLVNQASAKAESSSSDDVEALKATQLQLEQELIALKAQAAALPTSTTTTTSQSTGSSASSSSTSSTSDSVVHLNSADQVAIETLPGIGATKGKAIIDYRTAHGKFSSIDELLNVKGIGTATLAKMKPQLTLD